MSVDITVVYCIATWGNTYSKNGPEMPKVVNYSAGICLDIYLNIAASTELGYSAVYYR
jgi:hypothetical protein